MTKSSQVTAEILRARFKSRVQQMSLAQLVEGMEMTEAAARRSDVLPEVREALMDEMERRNPDAFLAWLDSSEVSPRKFFIA